MADLSKIVRASANADEDRILRLWTPVLLRSIVIVAMTVLITGLILTATATPSYFGDRYRQVQLGHLMGRESFAIIWSNLLIGEPHAVLTVGLFLLALVPLARVTFCLMLFIKERDFAYIGFTGYVLAGLLVGLLLGRIG
jgi:uncharacterized membrane protein